VAFDGYGAAGGSSSWRTSQLLVQLPPGWRRPAAVGCRCLVIGAGCLVSCVAGRGVGIRRSFGEVGAGDSHALRAGDYGAMEAVDGRARAGLALAFHRSLEFGTSGALPAFIFARCAGGDGGISVWLGRSMRSLPSVCGGQQTAPGYAHLGGASIERGGGGAFFFFLARRRSGRSCPRGAPPRW